MGQDFGVDEMMCQPSEIQSRPQSWRRRGTRLSISFLPSTFDNPALNSLRTPCPRDTDAFSYDPVHLSVWHMSENLWKVMPFGMHESLAAMQHAGAAVCTGFERLDKLFHDLTGKVDEDLNDNFDDELAYRLMTSASAANAPVRTPSLTSLSSFPSSRGGSVLSHGSPENSPQSPASPISLFALSSPLLEQLNAQNKCSSGEATSGAGMRFLSRCDPTGGFQRPPQDPRVSQWRAEVSYMRENALVRLRHAIRRVEGEWRGIKRMEDHESADMAVLKRDNNMVETCNELATAFQTWLDDKKELASSLDVRGGLLGAKVSLGWGGGSPYSEGTRK